jgi:hypothetical protein
MRALRAGGVGVGRLRRSPAIDLRTTARPFIDRDGREHRVRGRGRCPDRRSRDPPRNAFAPEATALDPQTVPVQ